MLPETKPSSSVSFDKHPQRHRCKAANDYHPHPWAAAERISLPAAAQSILTNLLDVRADRHERRACAAGVAALGEHSRVREHRLFLQLAHEDKKCSEVERILRRRVRARVSGADPGPDLAVEVFLLGPESPDV
jgi:hypothetical protein